MKSLLFAILISTAVSALADDLPAGHPTVRDALEASGNQTNAAALPNQGKVISTLQSRGYTYIEVEHAGKNIWLAAPQTELADGTEIKFGQGIVMANFYSNGLKREFEQIFFVDRVETVK
ncbi:MAG: hypothetical protein PVG22_10935 [Chromatiales bacterium]|jgi:hypothetical protein